jgi:hypothetical protein
MENIWINWKKPLSIWLKSQLINKKIQPMILLLSYVSKLTIETAIDIIKQASEIRLKEALKNC